MNTIKTLSLLATTTTLAAASTSASAAVVTLTADDFTNSNQVSTLGSLVSAVNLGDGTAGASPVASNTTATAAVTVNGVTFASDPGDGTANLLVDSVTDFARPNYVSGSVTGMTDTEGQQLFNGYERGGTGRRGTLTGLTIGQAYQFQLLIDRNNGGVTASYGYSVSSGGPEVLGATTTGLGVLNPIIITGSFIATETTQDIFAGEDNTNIGEVNAYQLRAVPEPGSLALLGLGGLALVRRRRPITH